MCGFAFTVEDGRVEYGPTIYRQFLNAVAARKLSGQMLVFAGDVPVDTDKPIYMLQVVPVLGMTNKKLKGISFKEFEALRDAVESATASDPGLHFMTGTSEMGDVLSISDDVFPLRGNIELQDGKVVIIVRSEPTLFEMECLEMYPDIAIEEYPYDEDEAEDDNETVAHVHASSSPLIVLQATATGEIERRELKDKTADEFITEVAIQNRHMPFLDEHHIGLSQYALSGYEAFGRGTIFITNEPGEILRLTPETQLGYITEANSTAIGIESLTNGIATYKPETQFIITIKEGELFHSHLLKLSSPEKKVELQWNEEKEELEQVEVGDKTMQDCMDEIRAVQRIEEGAQEEYVDFINIKHKELSDLAIKGYNEEGRGTLCILREPVPHGFSTVPPTKILYTSEETASKYALTFNKGGEAIMLPTELMDSIREYDPETEFNLAMPLSQKKIMWLSLSLYVEGSPRVVKAAAFAPIGDEQYGIANFLVDRKQAS